MNISDVKNLAKLKFENFGISLFLNINAKERRHSDIQSIITHLFDNEWQNLTLNHYQKKDLRPDFEQIRQFFESEQFKQGPNRGIAIFSNSAEGFFEVFYLAQPIEDRICISKDFLIRPLASYLDKYPKFLAVLVDQQRGRFFEIEQGEPIDRADFRDEVPNKVREGGWYGYEEHHIERHVDDHIHQHLKKVSQKAFYMLKKYDFKWLILLGTPENLVSFKKTLHAYLKRKLIAEIPVELSRMADDKVFEYVFNFLNEKTYAEHLQLEEELSDKNTSRSVVGIKKVDEELNKKSVYKLLLSTAFSPVSLETGLDFKTNEMVKKALFQDSEIHFINNGYLDDNGGFGAILRY